MRILLKTRRFEVGRRRVEGRDGRPALHDIILHPGAVVVLPLLSDDELIMIRQYRSSLDRALWELPAGT
ncbi:MAG: NUDIX hydrolase, partial [Phycisphaerae bacterium]